MSLTPILDDAIAVLEEKDPASVLALADIAHERLRQIDREGWSIAHDDAHQSGVMSRAAGCYALGLKVVHAEDENFYHMWPWSSEWWKPKSPHRNRIRAAALLVADLARHLRSAPSTDSSRGQQPDNHG